MIRCAGPSACEKPYEYCKQEGAHWWHLVKRPLVFAPAESSLLGSGSTTLAAIFRCTRPTACNKLFYSNLYCLQGIQGLQYKQTLLSHLCSLHGLLRQASGSLQFGKGILARASRRPRRTSRACCCRRSDSAACLSSSSSPAHVQTLCMANFPGALSRSFQLRSRYVAVPAKKAPLVTKGLKENGICSRAYLLWAHPGACGRCMPWLQHVSRLSTLPGTLGFPFTARSGDQAMMPQTHQGAVSSVLPSPQRPDHPQHRPVPGRLPGRTRLHRSLFRAQCLPCASCQFQSSICPSLRQLCLSAWP